MATCDVQQAMELKLTSKPEAIKVLGKIGKDKSVLLSIFVLFNLFSLIIILLIKKNYTFVRFAIYIKYRSFLVKKDIDEKIEDEVKSKEIAILELGDLYASYGLADDLAKLINSIRPFLHFVSKAKAAKLVRTLVDKFLDMDAATGKEIEMCEECIEWATTEKRTFLRQALEVKYF